MISRVSNAVASAATVAPGIDYLATINNHKRDSMISFEEGPHIYTINGDSSFTSVTTSSSKGFRGIRGHRRSGIDFSESEDRARAKLWRVAFAFAQAPHIGPRLQTTCSGVAPVSLPFITASLQARLLLCPNTSWI